MKLDYLIDTNILISLFNQELTQPVPNGTIGYSVITNNYFNLNIPRYVDTFEEEEEIDLAAVAAKLRQCDYDMVAIDEAIKGFCDELGIDAPL